MKSEFASAVRFADPDLETKNNMFTMRAGVPLYLHGGPHGQSGGVPVKGREGCKSSYGCGARRQCVCALREAWKSQLMASFPSLSWYKDITV